MSKYIVAVFPDESSAYKGLSAVEALHVEGNLSLYGAAVIAKDAEGKTSIKTEEDEGPVGLALGMLAGGLLGAAIGPVGLAAGAAAAAVETAVVSGMVVGAAGGGLLGSLADLDNMGVGLDFLDLVGAKMEAGTVAVVAEVDEYWMAPLDARIEALNGEVFRRTRINFEDEQFAQEVQALNDELDALDAEIQEASDETKERLEAKRNSVRQSLKDAWEKGERKVEQLDNELKAKLAKLEKQAEQTRDDAKAKIDQSIADIKAGYKARIEKLKAAGHLIKEALS